MKLYKKEGNILQIISFPKENPEKGDYLLVEDVEAAKSLIAQVIDVQFAAVPGVLEELLRTLPKDSRGRKVEVTQGTISNLMHHPDRQARRSAYESYMDKYIENKNTLATNLAHSIKANVFYIRARRHESSLAASLFDLNISTDVFHNLIDTFRSKLPVWHRYFSYPAQGARPSKACLLRYVGSHHKEESECAFRKRRRADLRKPGPHGRREYVSTVRRGVRRDRWVDVYPNQGKMEGAFSRDSNNHA